MPEIVSQTILITGASGLLGTNLVDELLRQQYNVIGVSKSYPLKKMNLPQFQSGQYTPLELDITNFDAIKNIITTYKPSSIIHLAAQAIVAEGVNSPLPTFETNISGTWNVLEAARGNPNVSRIIIASSDKAYGEHSTLPYKEEFELRAIHPYDISKKITEQIAESYIKTFNLPITITRCGNIFGPCDLNFSRIVPGTIKSCLNNEKIKLRSNGFQTRSYIYVKDVVSAYLSIVNAPIQVVQNEVFNIGNDVEITVLDLTKKICAITGTNYDNIIVQNNSNFEISKQSLDSSKAKAILSWESNYSIDEALTETVKWYKSVAL